MKRRNAKDEQKPSLWAAVRHPLRMLAWAMAALSLTSAFAGVTGIAAAMIGALVAVPVGELLGRSRYRLPVLIGLHAGLLFLFLILGWTVTRFSLFPSFLGPATCLSVSVVLRFFGVAFAVSSGMRAVGSRHVSVMAVELFAVTAAVSVMFATHRDGVIARPLWLSDWAWRNGHDPVEILLFIGGAAVVVLGALLIAENRSRLTLASILTLPLLALLAILFLNVGNIPQPEGDNDLGLTESSEGDEPNPTPPGDSEGGNEPREDGGSEEGDRTDGGGGGRGERDGGSEQGEGERDGGGGGGERDGGVDGGGSEGDRDGGGSQGGRDSDIDGGGSSATQDGGGGSTSEDGDPSGGQCDDPQESDEPPPPSSEDLDTAETPSSGSAPMAVVLLEDDYSPEAQAYYFRQDAWSEWNGHRLVAARRADADQDRVTTYPTYRVTVRDPPPEKARTLVHARVALLTDHTHPFALESPVVFEPMNNPNPDRFVRAYRFESLALTMPYRELRGRASGDPKWSEELRAHYIQGSDDPRYAALANQIVNELPSMLRDDPFTMALAVKLHLDSELTYSTQERHANADDPTAAMLFGNKIGYCVHFAHAAVLLWRSLGIPSRVGTGYHAPEDNRRGSIILLRSNDGHAWPELYLEGVGWVILDIAAEENLDPPGQPMDEDLQEMLGEMARENPPEPLAEEPPSQPLQHVGRNLGLAVASLFVIALVLLYLLKAWRRFIPLVEGSRHMPRVGYRMSLDLLSEAGHIREHGETREDFAERLGDIVPAFAILTAWNVAARFGHPSGSREGREEFSVEGWKSAIKDFRKQLGSKTKLWRRLVGLLNPISFFFSR